VRDLDRVVEVVRHTADRVAHIRAEGFLPLVVGGDCTITIGVVAGLTRAENANDVGLVYFDGDADLNTPATSDSGVLDTMGVTHLVGDGLPSLAGVGARQPLLGPDRIELFGFDPAELDTQQWTRLTSRGMHATPAPAVREDPAARAAAALSRLETQVEHVLVHLDVDVLDTGLFPLANFPHLAGLTVPEVALCLRVFCSSDAFAGLVLTEVNPDHDPDGLLLPELIRTLAGALAGSP
jgi:arginase